MNTLIRKAVPVVVSMAFCLSAAPAVLAQSYHSSSSNYQHTYHPPAYQQPAYQQPVYKPEPITFHQYISTHPKIRSATIGAGVGTAAGAVTGLLTGRGVLRGAVIGAGAGAGTGLVRSSETMYRHPIVKNIATGSLVGLGLGLAGGRVPGTAMRTTGVGAATGMATGLLLHGL